MSDFQTKELSESDWQEYQSIRLASLRDSPDSFASTYEREALFLPEQWKSRLRISPTIHDAVALAAICDESFVGLVSCVIHTPDTDNANLYQMWVSPAYRGRGVGTQLLGDVKSWVASKGITTLKLSVTTTNTDAISLYQSVGFYPFGGVEPLRTGSQLESQMMEIKLNAPMESTPVHCL